MDREAATARVESLGRGSCTRAVEPSELDELCMHSAIVRRTAESNVGKEASGAWYEAI